MYFDMDWALLSRAVGEHTRAKGELPERMCLDGNFLLIAIHRQGEAQLRF